MDIQASPAQPRAHAMNDLIILMLTHLNPFSDPDLSVPQLEALRAVLLTAYLAGKPANLHAALLRQDAPSLGVLDGLCVRFVKRLICEQRTRRTGAGNERGSAPGGESRVSDRVKQIELQVQAVDESRAGVVGSRGRRLKGFLLSGRSLVRVVGSKIQ